MRILVISDTHGQLSLINDLVKQTETDIVLHCGDFEFMTHDRVSQLSKRELSLRIRHSSLEKSIRKKSFSMSREDMISLIMEHRLLGEFDEFYRGERTFDVPV